mmetsp:Transcript_84546/g.217815  ORF Transcript_84546/g.217815 Transcript_84546/m.217815 type:complete len:213 (-) Transcript_84546:243-881(-)
MTSTEHDAFLLLGHVRFQVLGQGECIPPWGPCIGGILANYGSGVTHVANVQDALAWVHQHDNSGSAAELNVCAHVAEDVIVRLAERTLKRLLGLREGILRISRHVARQPLSCYLRGGVALPTMPIEDTEDEGFAGEGTEAGRVLVDPAWRGLLGHGPGLAVRDQPLSVLLKLCPLADRRQRCQRLWLIVVVRRAYPLGSRIAEEHREAPIPA